MDWFKCQCCPVKGELQICNVTRLALWHMLSTRPLWGLRAEGRTRSSSGSLQYCLFGTASVSPQDCKSRHALSGVASCRVLPPARLPASPAARAHARWEQRPGQAGSFSLM